MTATLPALPIIQARCKWCINRLGFARYRVNGNWMALAGAEIVQDLSDGICGDCLELELRKVPVLNLNFTPNLTTN